MKQSLLLGALILGFVTTAFSAEFADHTLVMRDGTKSGSGLDA